MFTTYSPHVEFESSGAVYFGGRRSLTWGLRKLREQRLRFRGYRFERLALGLQARAVSHQKL